MSNEEQHGTGRDGTVRCPLSVPSITVAGSYLMQHTHHLLVDQPTDQPSIDGMHALHEWTNDMNDNNSQR